MEGLVKKMQIDLLQVYIFESRAKMGVAAFECYKKNIMNLSQNSLVRAVFAAAHSQSDFYEALINDSELNFSRINAFHMDEYMGLGKDASQNFGNFLNKAIFSKKPFYKVNYINSEAKDIESECVRYERLLREAPLDIVSLGIGENGHIAFNDPHEARFDDLRWVRETSLDDVSRQQQVNDGEFEHISQVPKRAVTVTIPALMSCKYVVGIVPTSRKAQAVYNALYGPINEMCPASILRTHKNATLFLDKDAAELINI